MKIKRFKQSQRLRVIVNGVCFYTTAKQVRDGIGDLTKCNIAIQKCMADLETARSYGGIMGSTVGHVGTWEQMSVQMDMA